MLKKLGLVDSEDTENDKDIVSITRTELIPKELIQVSARHWLSTGERGRGGAMNIQCQNVKRTEQLLLQVNVASTCVEASHSKTQSSAQSQGFRSHPYQSLSILSWLFCVTVSSKTSDSGS